MIYLNKNSSAPAQKLDLENSLQQSFTTLSKLLIFRYICALLFEGRDQSRMFILRKLYKDAANYFFNGPFPINGHSKRRTP